MLLHVHDVAHAFWPGPSWMLDCALPLPAVSILYAGPYRAWGSIDECRLDLWRGLLKLDAAAALLPHFCFLCSQSSLEPPSTPEE